MRHLKLIPLLLLLSACLYYNGLDASYVHDDIHAVRDNPAVNNGIGPALAAFIDASTFSSTGAQMYRPITILSLAADQAIFGPAARGASHRAMNIFIHTLVCFMLLLLANRSLKFSLSSALAISVLFAANPMNTMAVNYLTARSTLLAAFFFLLALILYLEWRLYRKGAVFLVLAALFYLASCLSKETGALLPLVILGGEFIWAEKAPLSRSKLAIVAGLFALTACGYLGMRAYALEAPFGGDLVRGWAENLLTQLNAWLLYAKLFLWPTGQAFIRPFPVMSIKQALPGVAALILIIAAAIYSCRKLKGIGLGTLIFIAALLPTTVVPLNVIVSEERGYLAWIGLSIGLAHLFELKHKSGAGAKVTVALIVAIIFCFSALTVKQNSRWVGAEGIFRRSAAMFIGEADKLSQSERESVAKAMVILGGYRKMNGLFAQAEAIYNNALEVDPTYYEAHNNLGSLALAANDLAKAKRHFERAVLIFPDYPIGHFNLGVLAQKSMDIQTARVEYEKAIELRPFFPEAHRYLGGLLYMNFPIGSPERKDALKHLKTSLEQAPRQPDTNELRRIISNLEAEISP